MRPNVCTVGMAGYTKAPSLAWSGWRLRIPGGPIGGQYHGFIAADSAGWPAGREEIYRSTPPEEMAGLGSLPFEPWNSEWGGTSLHEGETVSDYVYRGPAEVRPRPNASGGTHVVHGFQTKRSAGYAIAPGNYKGIGAMPNVIADTRFLGPPLHRPLPPIHDPGDHQLCPSWGCEPYPWGRNIVRQPPPPHSPAPSPTTGTCPGGYIDAAGNCTTDWHNPYALYLPNTVAASPADYLPGQGQPLDTSAATPTATSWLEQSSLVPGVKNMYLAGGGALAMILLLKGRK